MPGRPLTTPPAAAGRCAGCGGRVARPATHCRPCYRQRGRRNGPLVEGKRAPEKATAELPGSPGKVAVLEERYLAGERLWHPGDATWED